MQKASLEFFEQLIETPSPSGFEAHVQDLIAKRMRKYADKVTIDVHGNAVGVLNAKASCRVMIAGHCDEIGFIITHIDSKGFIYIAAVGGVDPGVALGQRVNIHSDKGRVYGVIGRGAIHLLTPEQRVKLPKMSDLWIDIGAKNRKDAEKVVRVGDYATLDVGFGHMRNNLVVGRGFDDRAGAFVVTETLRRLKSRKLDVAVYGVSTVQEEIGLRGAKTSSYDIDPHVGIAVDVGFATDCPGSDPKRVGECFLGKGPALHRGPNINRRLATFMESVAKKKKIAIQITAEPRATGTDANAMQVNRAGSATALVSIPNRYMHSPVEMISLNDLDNTSKLLAECIAAMKSNMKYEPRPGK
jgi:putative aminopeptidase FrvX